MYDARCVLFPLSCPGLTGAPTGSREARRLIPDWYAPDQVGRGRGGERTGGRRGCVVTGRFRPISTFASEAEERASWETHHTTGYLDWSQAQRAVFPGIRLLRDRAGDARPAGLLPFLENAPD